MNNLEKAALELVGTLIFLSIGYFSIKESTLLHPVLQFPIGLLAALLVSGGDLNPAISIAKWTWGDYSFDLLAICISAQIVASLLAYTLFKLTE